MHVHTNRLSAVVNHKLIGFADMEMQAFVIVTNQVLLLAPPARGQSMGLLTLAACMDADPRGDGGDVSTSEKHKSFPLQ